MNETTVTTVLRYLGVGVATITVMIATSIIVTAVRSGSAPDVQQVFHTKPASVAKHALITSCPECNHCDEYKKNRIVEGRSGSAGV